MKRFFLPCIISLLLLVSSVANASDTTIRFGILPVLDTLPLQVAVHDRLFAANGLNVELISFASALERDTAMQAGQLDGYFGDLIATFLLVSHGVPMRIALTSYRTVPGMPMFGICTSPAQKDATLNDLKGVKIGYSKSTIMEYLLDRISGSQSIPADHFERVEVKKIPIRLQMLLGGQLGAAILPEPLLSLVSLKGGKTLVTAENLDMPLTVLCLHEKYFKADGKLYHAFTKAYAEAVRRLAKHLEQYRELMVRTCRIPPRLAPEYPIYPYPAPALPSEKDIMDVQQWMIAHNMLKSEISADRVLSPVAP